MNTIEDGLASVPRVLILLHFLWTIHKSSTQRYPLRRGSSSLKRARVLLSGLSYWVSITFWLLLCAGGKKQNR